MQLSASRSRTFYGNEETLVSELLRICPDDQRVTGRCNLPDQDWATREAVMGQKKHQKIKVLRKVQIPY
jgi:hypothetical protein